MGWAREREADGWKYFNPIPASASASASADMRIKPTTHGTSSTPPRPSLRPVQTDPSKCLLAPCTLHHGLAHLSRCVKLPLLSCLFCRSSPHFDETISSSLRRLVILRPTSDLQGSIWSSFHHPVSCCLLILRTTFLPSRTIDSDTSLLHFTLRHLTSPFWTT